MKLIFISVLFLVARPTYSSQYQLEKIVHTESRTQNTHETSLDKDSVSDIDAEALKKSGPSSVDDILRQSPIATTSRGPRNSSETVQVRGLDASKIFIIVDGARQNYRGGHTSMIPIDLENLKTVKIYESSADFSKGNSLGGGIQFVTKDPEDYLLEGESLGSEFKFQNNSANAENIYNAKNIFKTSDLSGLISLTSQKANNTQLNNGEDLPNSAYEDFIGFVKLKRGDWTISHESYRRKDNSPLDPSLNPPDSIQSLQADSSIDKESTVFNYQKNELYINAYHTQLEVQKTDRESKTTETRSIDTTGTSFKKSITSTTFGAEAYFDRLDSDKGGSDLTSYPKAQSSNMSAFLINDFEYEEWTLTPGARLNHYSMQDDGGGLEDKSAQELSKKLKLKYSFDKNNYLYASYSEGFHSPRVSEVYPSGLHSPGDGWIVRDNYFIPNPGLKHETSANREIGLSGKRYIFDYQGSLSFKASIYENRVKDYIKIERIDRSTMDSEDGTSQFVNVPRANLYGGEAQLELTYDIYEWKVAYSQIRGKNETEDLYLEDLPADQYTYAFNVYLDRYRAQLGYLGIQAQEQNRTNPETLQRTEKTPGYFIHNIYGTKDFGKNFEVGLRIDNLGNKEYRRHGSFLYESKEDYKLTLKYKVKTL